MGGNGHSSPVLALQSKNRAMYADVNVNYRPRKKRRPRLEKRKMLSRRDVVSYHTRKL